MPDNTHPPTITIHHDNLANARLKRVISIEDSNRSFDFIQCYADSADINASGNGLQVYLSYSAETMDRICEEWQRFRRDLAAFEAAQVARKDEHP